jgi:4-carboxymuconolactone decarboxylase
MSHRTLSVLAGSLLVAASAAQAGERLPSIAPAQYNDEQREAAVEFQAARNGPVFGPFEPLMHSPTLMSRTRALGDYLRFKSAIGNTLSELAILITARAWSQDYEWTYHKPIAIKAGVKPEIIEAIAEGRQPQGMSDDEQLVYQFSTELHQNKSVSDATFARVEKRWGKKGAVDLTGINAYYTLLAMQLNVAQYPGVKGEAVLRRLP